jgi:catechol 2,3-dioxygenase-like lactoylglutathione lyase family enzyme
MPTFELDDRLEGSLMHNHLHHVHLFASDLEASVRFYTEVFGGTVVLDAELAGARNVFVRIGSGRLHLYDQPPRSSGRGSIHHVGIQTDDIDAVVGRLAARGIAPAKGVTELGVWRYVMVPAPDDVLVELFEVSREKVPEALRDYFE